MGKVAVVGVVAAVSLVLILGFYFIPRQTENRPLLEPTRQTAASTDLGVTYLPLTPRLSAYYDLGVDSGALVTEVAPNSLADRAGLKVGDVILSFNETRVEAGTSLLGMIRECPVGNNIVMEVCRGKSSQIVRLVHTKN